MFISSRKRTYFVTLSPRVVYRALGRYKRLPKNELQNVIDGNFKNSNKQSVRGNYDLSRYYRDLAKLGILVKEGGVIVK